MKVRHTFGPALVRIRNLKAKNQQAIDEAKELVGRRLLSWCQQDYKAKARHGEGKNFGGKWADITIEAIYSRLGKLKPYQSASPAQRHAMIQAAWANHEIGIDTSATIKALTWSAKAILNQSKLSITVGIVDTVWWAKYFDMRRPIFPTKLSAERLRDLDRIVQGVFDKVVTEAI